MIFEFIDIPFRPAHLYIFISIICTLLTKITTIYDTPFYATPF